MDLNRAMASGTVRLASHLLATASPAIRLASQAVALLPDASRIAEVTEKLVASVEALSTQAEQGDGDEASSATSEVIASASALAEAVAQFIGRANQVAVGASQLASPAVRLASYAQHFGESVTSDAPPQAQAPPSRPASDKSDYLTGSDVDRLLTQKLDQTLAEFRNEMQEFKRSLTAGAGPASGAPYPPTEEQSSWE